MYNSHNNNTHTEPLWHLQRQCAARLNQTTITSELGSTVQDKEPKKQPLEQDPKATAVSTPSTQASSEGELRLGTLRVAPGCLSLKPKFSFYSRNPRCNLIKLPSKRRSSEVTGLDSRLGGEQEGEQHEGRRTKMVVSHEISLGTLQFKSLG